ncbi:MAG: hypothetical protein J7L89_10475 [Bacteroidales bacterium]|nr:hypothetical protein [Bacteroidales bacterium]
MDHSFRKFLFILFWAILILPLIEMNSRVIPVKNLRGAGDPVNYPAFTFSTWFKGDFQRKFNQAVEEHLGFRPWLIRYRNQIDYSLLHTAHASGVVVGRRNYLFEKDYLRAFQGGDFLGSRFWDEKFRRLRMVSDTLRQMGKQLIVVLEPGKASFFPEYIPRRYPVSKHPAANYRSIIREAKENGIPLLDLNHYFTSLKLHIPYPLFPKGGIHWSVAGMLTCVDTLAGFLRCQTGFPIPDLVIDHYEFTHHLQDTDDDLARIMNLIWQPAHPPMAYPAYHFKDGDTLKRPRVLVISDSFYFNILNAGLTKKLFANEAFWYYNKTVYPDSWTEPKYTSSINLREEIHQTDLIVLMVTERFYYKFDWELTDQLYTLYYPDGERNYLYDYYRMIIRNYVWFDDVYAEAEIMGVSMEERLTAHAGYQFWVDDQKNPFPRDRAYYRMKILTDPDWMNQIREKAKAGGFTIEEQVERDAGWMVNQGL